MTRTEYLQRRFEFAKRGNVLPQAKLTAEDVRMIRSLHAEKMAEIARLNATLSAEAIAVKFDVHTRTIENVLNFTTWRNVR